MGKVDDNWKTKRKERSDCIWETKKKYTYRRNSAFIYWDTIISRWMSLRDIADPQWDRGKLERITRPPSKKTKKALRPNLYSEGRNFIRRKNGGERERKKEEREDRWSLWRIYRKDEEGKRWPGLRKAKMRDEKKKRKRWSSVGREEADYANPWLHAAAKETKNDVDKKFTLEWK